MGAGAGVVDTCVHWRGRMSSGTTACGVAQSHGRALWCAGLAAGPETSQLTLSFPARTPR